jgi:predicted DsbA family dithiol-disulfide isomerase
MPPEGQNLRQQLAQKYGITPEDSSAARTRLTRLGASLGFHFDYHDDMRVVNTFRAHQLLHWAGEQGRQTELKLALFEAFFCRREDVSDVETLVTVAGRIDLPPDEARAVLDDGRYADTVRSEQQLWLERDVHAVPTFVFNNKFMVPGAQEAEIFIRVLDKLAASEAA